jgi:hypothetical protein
VHSARCPPPPPASQQAQEVLRLRNPRRLRSIDPAEVQFGR